MRRLLIGLLGALVAASPLAAATNLVAGTTNPPPATVPDANDPVEKEYKKLMEDDDAAQAEVDQWIRGQRGGGGQRRRRAERRLEAAHPRPLRADPQGL